MNNLAVRTLSSAVFTAVMVAGLLLHPVAYGALFLVVMTVCMQEFFSMSLGTRFLLQQKIALLAAAFTFTLVLCSLSFNLSLSFLGFALLPLLAIPVSFLFRPDHSDAGDISFVFTALLYVALPLCLSPVLVFPANGPFCGFPLLSVFILIWSCDVGAYCVGTALGQRPGARKLAPGISPKKSWWGFWGGVALSMCASAALHFLGWMPYGLIHCVALGAVVAVAGVAGDLFESLWKRYFGVKDSGNCIPGHGGMLDRFDSSLVAIPAAVLYLALTNLL